MGIMEKGMATHSSVLIWRIPWTQDPGGLHSPQGCKETQKWYLIIILIFISLFY